MKRALCMVLGCWLMLAAPLKAAVEGKKAMYVGGTVKAIQERQQGVLDTFGALTLVFRWEKGKWDVPFASVSKIVYRDKVGF